MAEASASADDAGAGQSRAMLVKNLAKLSNIIKSHERDRERDETAARQHAANGANTASVSLANRKRPMNSSSSSSISGLIQPVDSMMSSSLQHQPLTDSDDMAASMRSSSAISPDESMPDIFGAEATMMDAAPPRGSAAQADRESFPRKGFTYEVEETPSQKARHPTYQRKESDIMELSPYYSLADYPKRVCIAENYVTKFRQVFDQATGTYKLKTTDDRGKELPKTRYKYWIYSRPSAFLTKVAAKSEETRHAFVIVEENEPVFAYFDFDLPEQHKRPVHGVSSVNLLGYALAMLRMLISAALGMNVLCVADGYVLYDSDDAKKWSHHTHVPWPFNERLSLAEVMKKAVTRLEEVRKDRLKAVAPLFFAHVDKKTGKDVETCVIDKNVFTKKRNFRVPYARKADKNAALVPSTAVDRWNRPEDAEMCGSESYYMGLSACMILCRNSREFWTPRVLKNADMLKTREDATAVKDDFWCMPVTGNSRAHFKALVELSSGANGAFDGATGQWRWSASGKEQHVDVRIEKRLEGMFRLLYDESWKDLTRNAEARGVGCARIVEDLMGVCRRSPLHAQAAMVLLAHCYKPGAGLAQRMHGSDSLGVFEAVTECARAVGDVLCRRGALETAFSHVWRFRTLVELTYSNTCTEEQRTERTAFLASLGTRASAAFTEQHALDGGEYDVRGCAYDCLFIDLFISELLLWSGQAVFVFQRDKRHPEAAPLDVLPRSDEDYEELLRKCVYYACTRLPGRQVDAPTRAVLAPAALLRPEPVYELIKAAALEAGTEMSEFAYAILKR